MSDAAGITKLDVQSAPATAAVATTACLIETAEAAGRNASFRRVLYTDRARGLQIVAMSVPPGGDIGAEVHARTDQLFLVPPEILPMGNDDNDAQLIDRPAVARLGGPAREDTLRVGLDDGDLLVVPAGTRHNISVPRGNVGPFRFLTIYVGDVLHGDDEVAETKSDAEEQERY